MEWQVAETQLSDAMQAEKDLVCRMNALQQKTEELEHGPEKASAILKQKSTRLEMEAAVQHRMKVQQWEEEARNRMNDVEEREAAAPSGQLAEEEKERLAALARAAEIQEKVAAALEHNYIAEIPASDDDWTYTPAWFKSLNRAQYQGLIEKFVFPDLDHVNWCLLPEVSEFLEAGIHGEGYRDIELDEWEEKHSQWEVLSAHKINFDKKYDELHQSMISAVLAVEKRTRAQLIMENEKERMFFLMQSALMVIALRETHNVMEMERDEMRKIEREMQCSRPWESTRKVLQQAIPASTAMCH
jgi:hypothetical protein